MALQRRERAACKDRRKGRNGFYNIIMREFCENQRQRCPLDDFETKTIVSDWVAWLRAKIRGRERNHGRALPQDFWSTRPTEIFSAPPQA